MFSRSKKAFKRLAVRRACVISVGLLELRTHFFYSATQATSVCYAVRNFPKFTDERPFVIL
jgi:hypothetical protein